MLVAPISYDGEIIGALSFDFYETTRSECDIVEKVRDNDPELFRLLRMAAEYADLVAKLLMFDLVNDRDFLE